MLILGIHTCDGTKVSVQVSEILKHQGSLSEAADLIGMVLVLMGGTNDRTGVICTGLWDSSDVQSRSGDNTVTISVFRKSLLLFGDMASYGKSGSTRLLAYSLGVQ